MPDVRAFRSGNWSDTTATSPWWNGTAIFAPAAGDVVYSNNFTITVDVSATCTTITNLTASSRVWKDGATAIATAGGGYSLANGVTLTANLNGGHPGASLLTLSGTNSAAVVGNVNNTNQAGSQAIAITCSSSGTLTITGNITGGGSSSTGLAVTNTSSGTINVTGNVLGAIAHALNNASTGTISVTGNVTAGASAAGANNASTGAFTIIGDITATNGAAGFVSANASATNRLSCSFINSANGTAAVYATRYFLNSQPLNARTRYALNGIGTYVDMFTADNNLGQANPTDVRSGVSYASGTLTGSLTVPARGSVALSVNYGPSMPFTATRSGTTATATLAYSYPLVVGDQITVTGASNSEWNGTYTIASVVSGTSVTFTVPDTHSVTAGTGALMQTTGTAVLDPAAVASAVWGAASRTITGGLVDTATTLTNSPDVPTESEIAAAVRTELDSNSTKLANLDASVSSRLASASYTAPANSDITAIKSKTDNLPASPAAVADIPTTAQIATAVESSILNESDGQQILNAIVGAIGNTNLSEVSLVAAVRADLERNGGKLINLDAAISSRLAAADYSAPTSAPTAASVATAVWSAATKEITGGTVTTLTNAPDVPTEAEIASAVWGAATKEITGGTVTTLTNAPTVPSAASIRAEIDSNSTQLAAIKAKTDLLPASPAATGDIPSANISAIKAKTDLLETTRLAQCSTVSTTGAQLAAALS